jgi:hypothetical protein
MASVRRRLLPVPNFGRRLGSARRGLGMGSTFAVRLRPIQPLDASRARRPSVVGRRWWHHPASQGLGGDPTACERIPTYLSPASRRPLGRHSSVASIGASIGQIQDPRGAAPGRDAQFRPRVCQPRRFAYMSRVSRAADIYGDILGGACRHGAAIAQQSALSPVPRLSVGCCLATVWLLFGYCCRLIVGEAGTRGPVRAINGRFPGVRACLQLSRMIAATNGTAPRATTNSLEIFSPIGASAKMRSIWPAWSVS